MRNFSKYEDEVFKAMKKSGVFDDFTLQDFCFQNCGLDKLLDYEAWVYLAILFLKYEPYDINLNKALQEIASQMDFNVNTMKANIRYAIKQVYGETAKPENVISCIIARYRFYQRVWRDHTNGINKT